MVAWVVISLMADGLKGPDLAMLGILILAALVGLALGLLIAALTRGTPPATAWMAAGLIMAVMVLLAGGSPSRARMEPWLKTAAGAVPSRWAFEGLLLIAEKPGTDLAETAFPAETERMGVTADTLALVAMLIGLAAAATFIARTSSTAPLPARPQA